MNEHNQEKVPTVDGLNAILSDLSRRFNGFGGNCASVAEVLNDVLGAGHQYMVVSGDHYEYADHILVAWRDLYWDMNGSHTREEVEARWAADGEELEEFVSLEGVAALADRNGIFAGGYDEDDFRDALIARIEGASPTVSVARRKGP